MEKKVDLKEQRKRLEERIKRLENDLKSPLSKDMEEDAVETKNRDVLYSLYRIEKQNLARIDAEIMKSN